MLIPNDRPFAFADCTILVNENKTVRNDQAPNIGSPNEPLLILIRIAQLIELGGRERNELASHVDFVFASRSPNQVLKRPLSSRLYGVARANQTIRDQVGMLVDEF